MNSSYKSDFIGISVSGCCEKQTISTNIVNFTGSEDYVFITTIKDQNNNTIFFDVSNVIKKNIESNLSLNFVVYPTEFNLYTVTQEACLANIITFGTDGKKYLVIYSKDIIILELNEVNVNGSGPEVWYTDLSFMSTLDKDSDAYKDILKQERCKNITGIETKSLYANTCFICDCLMSLEKSDNCIFRALSSLILFLNLNYKYCESKINSYNTIKSTVSNKCGKC